jgi:hypothetical protein
MATLDELMAAVTGMASSVETVKSTIDESKSMLRDFGAWKSQVDGALSELRSDITTLRQQLGRVALNPILGLDPAALMARAPAGALEGVDTTASDSNTARRPSGHGLQQHHRRV